MRMLVAGLLIVSSALVGCGGPKGEFGSRNLVLRPVLNQAQLDYYWHVKLSLPGGERIRQLYQLDECLYALTNRSRLLCMDATTGLWKWSTLVSTRPQAVFAPRHVNGYVRVDPASGEPRSYDLVLINSLTDLYVIDRASGELLRQWTLPVPATSAGATDGTYFYYGSTRRWYHVLDLRTGLIFWELDADEAITAPILDYEGVLYVTTEAGTVYATAVGNPPRLLWTSNEQQSVPMHGAVTAASHVDRRGLFVPCEDNRLYAYNRSTGSPLWSPLVCQGPLRDAVQVGEQTLFQYALRDRFYAVDVATGTVRWTLPGGRKTLAVMKDQGRPKVYLLDAARNLVVVDEMLGRVDVTIPMSGLELFVGNTTSPAIYAASSDGHLVCIRPQSAGRLMPSDLAVR